MAGGQRGAPLRGSPQSACWRRCGDVLKHQRHSLQWPGAGARVRQRESSVFTLLIILSLLDLPERRSPFRRRHVLKRRRSLRCSAWAMHGTFLHALQLVAVCLLSCF